MYHFQEPYVIVTLPCAAHPLLHGRRLLCIRVHSDLHVPYQPLHLSLLPGKCQARPDLPLPLAVDADLDVNIGL